MQWTAQLVSFLFLSGFTAWALHNLLWLMYQEKEKKGDGTGHFVGGCFLFLLAIVWIVFLTGQDSVIIK